jgi:integrase/recombinase XerD
MPVTLLTTVNNISKKIPNLKNAGIINSYYEFMKESGNSERYQRDCLKCMISYAVYLNQQDINEVKKKETILSYLKSKEKTIEEDPDRKWITTWNDYLGRIKKFYRWLHNQYGKEEIVSVGDWITPEFVKIKNKLTKRLSPYLESELWDREELALIIKYEQFKRNKAAIALMWDLDARNHEVTLLKIKHIRLKEKYGEGEIPHQAKTGSGPILLTFSFPYVRDWLNEHPFRNESDARLICNLHNGSPIKPDALWLMMKQLRSRIKRLIESGSIEDGEREKLEFLLKSKRFNPYCLRHSSITYDSDYLPEYALKKKCRWTMNSRQGNRYIKARMGNDLKQKILIQNGILPPDELKGKPSVLNCGRCSLVNAIENKYCSKCSYPLSAVAFDEIKLEEDNKFKSLAEKYDKDMKEMREQMNHIVSLIQENPKLAKVKTDVLGKSMKK